jgi:hypothetical protein
MAVSEGPLDAPGLAGVSRGESRLRVMRAHRWSGSREDTAAQRPRDGGGRRVVEGLGLSQPGARHLLPLLLRLSLVEVAADSSGVAAARLH